MFSRRTHGCHSNTGKYSWTRECTKIKHIRVRDNPEEYFSNHRIVEVVRITIEQQHGLDFIEEIIVMRENNKPYSFFEADFKYLNKNDTEDMCYLCLNKKVNYREKKLLNSLMTFIRLGLKDFKMILRVTAAQCCCDEDFIKLNKSEASWALVEGYSFQSCQVDLEKFSTAEPENIPKGYTQAASSKVQTAPNCASHSDEIICSFFAQQASMPTTHDDEDLLQIDEDAMEEIDIRWQVAMITARIRKFM
ncbi:hypothetical protein Tco_1086376, partial [Tanacetum coccineum]